MADAVQINIDRKTVETVLQAQVQAAVAAQMASNPQFMEGIVLAMVNSKVDYDGKPTGSGYGTPLVAHLSQQVVQVAVRAAVQQWADDHKPDIVRALRRHLDSNKSNFIKRFCEAADHALGVQMSVGVTFKDKA